MSNNDMMFTVVLIRTDDWQVLYLNGEVYCEDHEIRSEDWLNAIKDVSNSSDWGYEVDELFVESDEDEFLYWEFPRSLNRHVYQELKERDLFGRF